ncbi:hypothetical protein FE257_007627 [Aspergillus nanangensis]|uniref:Transcription elongation factor Eaf N-terminal domain-containing protein n=1 Tax=Aspergillus nanangensis TaxID=2582783 RepID=A0AAD4GV60_ASPNN|nr:hypothetical protein FE257_007627 [Aspergillus nanangensis]
MATGGLVDPTKQAEYPIILGDRLAGNHGASQSQLVNVQYNYRTKSATARSVITPSSQSRNHYKLTITDKAPGAEQNVLTYSYQGSVDPEQAIPPGDEQNLILVFDPERKAFVLESVATQLNFNLRSAPAKTESQVIEQYQQLRIAQDEDQGSGDDQASVNTNGVDEGPPDESNPYDFRHFLPKANADGDKSMSDNATPEPQSGTSKANTPLLSATTERTPSPRPKPKSTKPQANPLRQPKKTSQPAKRSNPAPSNAKTQSQRPIARDETATKPRKVESREIEYEAPRSSPSDNGTGAISAVKATPSPGTNIIIDGDLIIDMGSPPPSRPTFKVNPAHFSSNNTPATGEEEDEDEDIETLRLPSPARHGGLSTHSHGSTAPAKEEEVDDDDLLVADLEAALEESAREKEARSPRSQRYHVPSEDESEISEEE